MTAVTFALPAESSDFIRLLQDRKGSAREPGAVIAGSLHGREIRVVHTGAGEKSTHARLIPFLATEPPQMLITSGFAGATSDDLKPGDVLLAENFCTADLLLSVRSALVRTDVHYGKLATARSIIDSAADRAAFAREHAAAAVDMETQFIVECCAQRGIPMLCLRAITDTPSSPLPAPPHLLFDIERQRTDAGRLALYLATHPLAIGKLFSFARRVNAARATLTATLDLLLRSESLASPRC